VNISSDILVLGASGFLGKHLVSLLGARAIAHSRDVAMASTASSTADFEEDGQLQRLLDAQAVRVLVNCAALSSPAACEADPSKARLVNSDLPRALGVWAAATGARVIHVSTDLVFGASPAPPDGFREEDEPAPLSVYGESKAQGERALLKAAPEALVVRLPLLYGDGRGTGRGASDVLFATLEKGEVARLFEDEWRTPLPVSVAAAALSELCDMDTSGLLHVAGAERVSRLELAHALHVCRFQDPGRAGRELVACKRADLVLTPPRPEDTSLCSQRARALLETELPGLMEGVPAALAPA